MDLLITEAELHEYLQRPIDPAAAALAVAGATGAVRSYCGWTISREIDTTLSAAGTDTRVVGLPTMALTSVGEVRVDDVVLAEDKYRWSLRGQLYCADGWPDWTRIDVDCDHGYLPVPSVVKIVGLGIAARYLTNPESLKIATVGSVARTYADMTALDAALLDRYRLP